MKSVVLTGRLAMRMREAPMPRLRGPRDVLLKIAAVGVCGSDIHYYREGRIGSQVVTYPFAVGHEFSAVVQRVGAGVRNVKPGDLVAVDPAMSCGACDQCRAGRPHTCRRLRFLGCPGQADGCLMDYLVLPAACCFPVKPSITPEQAALLEPLSVSLYAVKKSAPLKGKTAAVLGSGPIGLGVLLCARQAGAKRLYATDKLSYRLHAARKAGAVWAGNPDRTDIVKAIARREPLLLDIVFECCGQQEAVDQAMDLLKPGGTLVLVGIPSTARVSLLIDKARRKEILIVNIRRQCDCVQPALDLIESGKLKVDFLVTHRFPFAETKKAFDLVEGYRDGVIKAMILMD